MLRLSCSGTHLKLEKWDLQRVGESQPHRGGSTVEFSSLDGVVVWDYADFSMYNQMLAGGTLNISEHLIRMASAHLVSCQLSFIFPSYLPRLLLVFICFRSHIFISGSKTKYGQDNHNPCFGQGDAPGGFRSVESTYRKYGRYCLQCE